MKNSVVVVGSANMDLVLSVGNFPRPGETIFGSAFQMFPGGKGANQAVCAAKLGAPVSFIGKVGSDVLGTRLITSMKREGVDLRNVLTDGVEPTGIALITINERGQNEIVVVSGANMRLTPGDLRKRRKTFARAGVVLTQLEIPLGSVELALKWGRTAGAITLLDPAPARRLSKSLLRLVDILTPNETEAEILTGLRVTSRSSAVRASRKLLGHGVGNVIVTRGAKGCLWVSKNGVREFPAVRVKAVDTTAAGDAFSGALAYSLARHRPIEESIGFASRVAGFSVTKMGAQPSMPTMTQLRRLGL